MPSISFLVTDIHFLGGGERVTINLSNLFVDKGYSVSIVSIGAPRQTKIAELTDGVKLDYLGVDVQSGSMICRILKRIKVIILIRQYYRNKHVPTFIFGMGTYPSILIALLSRKYKLITIGCEHTSYEAIKGMWSLLRKWFYPRLNAIVSLTQQDGKKLSKHNVCVSIIPNSVSFYPDCPAPRYNNIILTVGRVTYEKGIDLLLDVFASIFTKISDWKLRIVGGGREKEIFEQRVRNDDTLCNIVDFVGESNNVEDEYANASIYVMTSRTEGLPMVLLEAQAYGLPIVAFNSASGISNIVSDGNNGFLIPCFNKHLMAERIVELCNNRSLRIKMGNVARVDVKAFAPNNIIAKWERLFDHLLKHNL